MEYIDTKYHLLFYMRQALMKRNLLDELYMASISKKVILRSLFNMNILKKKFDFFIIFVLI